MVGNAASPSAWVPPEADLSFLGSRAELREDLRERFDAALDRQLDWRELFTHAAAHGVLPLLSHHLLARADRVPEEFLGRLRERQQLHAAGNLLKAVASLTSGRVKFQRRALDPEGDLSEVPFLYLTGHHDFRLSERAVQNLRAFLGRGGFLLANSCCGRLAFDAAFRREIARVVPDGLKSVSPDHPLLACHFKIDEIGYTPLVRQENPGLRTPNLEGITVEGQLRVLYSPFDLGNGWERVEHPFTRGVAEKDAFRMAINAIIYAMTH